MKSEQDHVFELRMKVPATALLKKFSFFCRNSMKYYFSVSYSALDVLYISGLMCLYYLNLLIFSLLVQEASFLRFKIAMGRSKELTQLPSRKEENVLWQS